MKINQINGYENTVVFFHHPRENDQNSIKNQEIFIEKLLKKSKKPIEIINYVIGEDWKLDRMSELGLKYPRNKNIIILNAASMPTDVFDKGYKMYSFFNLFQEIGWGDIYLMDVEGKLYQEIDIKKLKI